MGTNETLILIVSGYSKKTMRGRQISYIIRSNYYEDVSEIFVFTLSPNG